jgi:hypothetical protein
MAQITIHFVIPAPLACAARKRVKVGTQTPYRFLDDACGERRAKVSGNGFL